jgi:LysR family transcriptional regulator, glycine cleavage system transcriptional activator
MSKYRLPVLNSLRAFEAAARYQSVQKAGRELHVNHASVSRHIHNLELRLGRVLFARHHKKIVLTDDGETLLGAVSMGFSIIERAIVQLSTNKNPQRLVISVDPDFAGLWLVPRLAEFYAIAPNILVEILVERGFHSSDDPRIDCAIHYAEAGLNLENSEVLFRSRLFPVCAPSLAQLRPLRSPEDLRRHLLLHDRSIVEWQEFFQNCSVSVDIDVRLGPIFGETALCMDAAVRGQGVAMGDDFLAATYLSEGRLVKPFDSSFLSKNAYFFIVPEGAAEHPAVDTFRTWLLQSIDRSPNN